MSTISASNQQYAGKYLQDATAKFEAIKLLDNNPLVDKDSRPGEVSVAVDNWTSTASVRSDGSAASFQWKSSERNPHAQHQDDIQYYTESVSLESDPAKSLTTVIQRYNEESEDQSNHGYRAIFHHNDLLVFDQF